MELEAWLRQTVIETETYEGVQAGILKQRTERTTGCSRSLSHTCIVAKSGRGSSNIKKNESTADLTHLLTIRAEPITGVLNEEGGILWNI
jgi:hypothetical protein